MNRTRLYEILGATTSRVRPGEPVTIDETGNLTVVTIDVSPTANEVIEAIPNVEIIDMVLTSVAVNPVKAEGLRDELVEILDDMAPDELEAFASGPSYITVGAIIGDQGAAFQLFGLGKVLGLWTVLTPGTLGITDAKTARTMAGNGFVMCSGYRPTVDA